MVNIFEMGVLFILKMHVLITLCIFLSISSVIEGHQTLDHPSWYSRNGRQNHYKEEVKNYPEVPFAGSSDARVNLANLAQIKGSFYLHELQRESGLGVFKLRLFEDRIILGDPVAIQAMYDKRLTEKSTDAGLLTVNGLNLNGYFSSASTNGLEKIRKKRGMLRILRRAGKEAAQLCDYVRL